MVLLPHSKRYGFWEAGPAWDTKTTRTNKPLPVWRSFYDRLYGFPVHEKPGYVKIAKHGSNPEYTYKNPVSEAKQHIFISNLQPS